MTINMLADVAIQLFDVQGEISLNFIEKFIGILIGAVGITGLGIILYCLILKVIVLPLDIWQKATTRKQSLKMEKMRGQLEKLQAQYANNPELYQKKMQEVYKENNYNMFASCIPMIATLVILLVAFQSLTGFSQYKNLTMYTSMASAYDSAILSYYDEEATAEEYTDSNGVEYLKYEGDEEQYFIYSLKHQESGEEYYYIDVEKMVAYVGIEESECQEYVKSLGREAAAESYYENVEGFFWIKNIYYADVYWAHPLQEYDDFCSAITRDIVNGDGEEISIEEFISESTYNEIIYNLTDEQEKANGYFILVVLTILANVGSQLITMRSQKAQRELQTADKSSQSMQKWMMFIMPVLFCIFAFIYSAAFSLYLITSSLFSLCSTLIINKVIDVRFKKKEEKEEAATPYRGGRKALTRDWEQNKEKMKEEEKQKKARSKEKKNKE